VSLTEQLREIEATLKGGMLGVAATFLPTGESVFYNADEVFPTASVIKVAIVSELYTQAAEGRLSVNEMVEVTAETITGGSGVLSVLTPGVRLPLQDLAMLTICVSDNTASNLCLAAVGGKDMVNARMHGEWGMSNTTIHRPIRFALQEGDPPHTATGTPRDMQTLVTLLAEGKVHSPEVSASVRKLMAATQASDMLPRHLSVNPFAEDLKAPVPPFTVEHKTGGVNGVRHDAGLITQEGKTLSVCVYTKGVPDNRWTPVNIGSTAVAEVARVLVEDCFG